jgi:NAD(P)-dependent dehydrogenase (short-subunit alcohol dehydrogenase family)
VPDHDFRLHPPDARLLEGRRALVTGAASGTGQGTAFELAAHGAAVAINHRWDEALRPVDRQGSRAPLPLGRWGKVSDVARAVAWVASDQAQYVVGTTLFVDGGMTLYPKFV